MAGATVTPLARFPLFTSMGFPVIHANQPFILAAQPAYLTYMPYPDGQGDVIWQGAEFGLTAPNGANVTLVEISVTHRVSNTTAYPSVTAQVYASGSPVGSPKAFTPSITLITETITVTSGITASALSSLAVRLKFHSAAMGLAYVHQAYATANYSFANAVGIITVAGTTSVASPRLTVSYPTAHLVAAGASVQSLSPSFGKPVTAGSLLIAWTFSNSGSATFDTTCSNPQWILIGTSGGAFGWRAMWYRNNCNAGEAPPVFTSTATFPASQLAEFANARGLDQYGVVASPSQSDFTVSASAPDTKSGDLVVASLIWAGANFTPATIGVTGADSSGAALPSGVISNAATTGQLPAAIFWGQASPPAGPGTDAITGTLNVFAAGGGVVASFFAVQNIPPVIYAASMSSM